MSNAVAKVAAKGWAPIPNDIFQRVEWSKTDLLVYIAMLCQPFDPESNIVTTRLKDVATAAGVHHNTVRTAIQRLTAESALVLAKWGNGRPDEYYVYELERENGFYALPNRWLDYVPLTSTEKIIYLVLMGSRNRHNGEATIAWSLIRDRARVRPADIGPALDKLERYGLIFKRRQLRTGKKQGVNKYLLPNPFERVTLTNGKVDAA
jgi:predicted transcriptional regulator